MQNPKDLVILLTSVISHYISDGSRILPLVVGKSQSKHHDFCFDSIPMQQKNLASSTSSEATQWRLALFVEDTNTNSGLPLHAQRVIPLKKVTGQQGL